MAATEHDHRFRVFGTEVCVLLRAATPLDALRVHALFRRLHRTLSRFDPASELSALNARAGRGSRPLRCCCAPSAPRCRRPG